MKKFCLILVFSFYFLHFGIVSAAITIPYMVDEKARVLFGDSVATSTYNGLENYTHDYVGGYLHLTFTYTHVFNSFASNPPRLYVTDIDPVATTTQQVRLNQVVYQLMQSSHNPEHISDWYLYDIQFDATGYRVSVKRGGNIEILNEHTDVSGILGTDWVALANQQALDNPVNEYSMSFTPIRITELEEEPPVATTTPVIIVPGIMGTKLLENSNLIWPNFVNVALSQTDDFLDVLKMDVNGLSINPGIVTGEILKNVSNADYWQGLIDNFDEDSNLDEFSYDWRLDIDNIADSLKDRIEEIKSETGVTKVNIVAHSMGGLVTKQYLKDYGGESINKFVDIGTPHIGAPSVFKTLNFGDNLGVNYLFGIFNVNKDKIKDISQNMPSVYQLLPSQKYFEGSDSPYYIWDGINTNNRLTFTETSNYLNTQGRNTALVDRANIFHQEIDNLNPSDYGVETYNIVGCGTPTIGQFYLLEGGEHPIYNIKMINGDGTVPLRSAESLMASTTYYVRNAQHALTPSTTGVKELITNLLSTTTPDISSYSNLSLTSGGCTVSNGKIVSFHSPIELHIYDSSDNHTGPDANGDIENEVSGVIYEVIGDNKFAFLPDGVEYTIKGEATSEGSFDVRIQELVNGEVATTTVFADIPLGLNTQTQFSVGSNIPTQIPINNDNDNTFEQNYGVSTITTGVLETTGKLIKVAQTMVVDIVSSKPIAESTERLATSTEEKTLPPVATTTVKVIPVTPTLLPKEVKETIATTSAQEPKYENTAVVYKSLTYKVKAVFTRVWGWFKSKI